MPYISKTDREELNVRRPNNPGELQYIMAMMFAHYINDHGKRYQTMNDVMGALAGAHSEFYRKIVIPFEDNKIAENGGIYKVWIYKLIFILKVATVGRTQEED